MKERQKMIKDENIYIPLTDGADEFSLPLKHTNLYVIIYTCMYNVNTKW